MSKESRKLAKNKLDDSYEWPSSIVFLFVLFIASLIITAASVATGYVKITPFDGDDTYIEIDEDFWKVPDVIDKTFEQQYKEPTDGK